MDTGKKVRLALYSRVSSDEQAREGVSIDAQVAALRAYAKAMGGEIFDEYVDGGFSGGSDDRPAFRRMMLDAKQRRFDVIVTCKLDRFFRNLRLLLNYLHELDGLGIKFISTQEGLDTATSLGKSSLHFMGTIGEFERDRIGERVRDARHHILSKGEWPGGSTLYGYRWLKQERKWEVIPGESAIVKRIYELYVCEGIGMIPIADRLNEDGILTRKGFPWNVNKVRQVLTHPGYKGEHPLDIKMPPIIDEKTWQKAQDKREGARTVLHDPKGWLLQGMAYCGYDGHLLKCLKKNAKQPAYYACRGRIDKKRKIGKCDLPYIRADKLETAVWGRLKEVLSDKEKLRDCVDKGLADLEARKTRTGADALIIKDKLAELQAKKERLGIAFADGTIPEKLYNSMLGKLKKDEASLLQSRHGIDPSRLEDLAALEAHIMTVKEFLDQGEFILEESGLYAVSGKQYLPLGFNAFRPSDGKIALGEIQQKETVTTEWYWDIDAARLVSSEWVAPPSDVVTVMWWDTFDPAELREAEQMERTRVIAKNLRGLFQLFDIKVYVYRDRIEIKGIIPPQLIYLPKAKSAASAPIIGWGRGIQGDGDSPT